MFGEAARDPGRFVVSATIRAMRDGHAWWQRGVVYQVYPRSFQDSNGDGVGDLPGVLQHLDYLQWLGVDAVWLSPIFPSPMADFGYDVSDYTDVHPLFGNLADLDRLIEGLHARGMKLLLDFVPNHTSDQHPWFVESRSSRASPKRDWYVWRDPRADGSPPNSYVAAFGGSSWEWDARTRQFYFHSFLKEQPDLDWTNPVVRDAMGDVLRFWFRRGIDGFRIDVITLVGKSAAFHVAPDAEGFDPTMPDDPARADAQRSKQVWGDEPGTQPAVAAIRAVANEFQDRVLIGEVYLPVERLVVYYGTAGEGIQLPFNFELLSLPWETDAITQAIERYERLLPADAWPNWVLGNHDRPRVATRIGEAQARVAAMLLLTLRGTPTLYYGDELGLPNMPITREQEQDPFGIKEPGQSRDPERTPMRWDGSPGAGFSTGVPWLPVGPRVAELNVKAERADPRSVLHLHRRLLELRRREPALSVGAYRSVGVLGSVMAYERTAGPDRFLVVLNLGHEPAAVPSAARTLRGTIAVSTHLDRDNTTFDGALAIGADEGIVVQLVG